MQSSNAIIRFDNVGVTLGGERIYDGLSFAVEEGEFLCILGPSGCGKSTSLRIMGDLLGYSDGEVRIAGRPPREAWKDLAYVFQSPRLAPWRDALGNVALGLELRDPSIPKAERERTARDLLRLVGLEADQHKFPIVLSGGERSRVAIARALSVSPRIVLMDEPFAALDVNTRTRMRDELIAIWRQTGKTIVFVTHDIEEAMVLADRILLLSNKPTRVLDTIRIREARPRRIEETAALKRQRDHLLALFRSLESGAEGDDNHGQPREEAAQ